MHRGHRFSAFTAMVALAGCNGESAKLTIRSMPAPVSSIAKPVPLRVAEARGQLALGNVALALESYRKAVREQPDNVDALAGMAACYDQMGRFDLSQRNYEAALALAPRDTALLGAFASSLDQQGRSEEAAGVRDEIKGIMAASFHPPVEQLALKMAQPALAPPPAVPVSVVAARSVTIALPAPRPLVLPTAPTSAEVASSATPAAPVPVAQPAPALEAQAQPAAPVAQAPVRAIAAQAQTSNSAIAPKPAEAEPRVAAANAPAVEAEQSRPAVSPSPPLGRAPAASPAKPMPATPVRSVSAEPRLPATGLAPRLERLSLGEVALVTSGRPQWRAQTVQRSERSTTIRFVPLRSAGVQMAGMRLLNAARYQGIAANTRSFLAVRGWRKIEIGDAAKVRQTSLILYPPSRRQTAKRLAAQFGVAIASRPEGSELVMLIGRDANRFMRHAKG